MATRKKRGGAYSVSYAGREAAGNLRRRNNTLTAPNIRYNEAGPETLYTVVIWDPDAPREPSFLHWLVVNAPGADLSRGTVLQEYYPPTPPAGSGEHRYYVGLYEQSGSLDLSSIPQTGFSIEDFTGRHGLKEKGLKMVRVKAGF